MNLETLKGLYDRFRGAVDSLYLKSGDPFPSYIPLSFTNLSGVFTICSKDTEWLPLNRFLKKLKKESAYKKLKAEDDTEQIDFDDPSLQEPLQRLSECLEEDNLNKLNTIWDMDNLTEEQLLVGIGVHLVKKLTGEAYTSEDRACEACPCGCGDKLDTAKMCIGSNDVWHGELDLRAGNEAAAIQVNTTKFDQVEDSENTKHLDSILCQIVGKAIVFAWTEYNRHREKSPLIPSVLIMHEGFTFFIYNPKTDELFSATGLTRLRPGDHKESSDKYAGIVLLWILLNHRLFFRHKLNVNRHIESGFASSDISKYRLINTFVKDIEPVEDDDEFVISRRGHMLQRDIF